MRRLIEQGVFFGGLVSTIPGRFQLNRKNSEDLSPV
jgi:hypothetical protein